MKHAYSALIFCCFLAVLSPIIIYAQSSELTKSLSPQSQTTLERLSELNYLPRPEWKFHVGNIPHGEAPDLDDSGWDPAPQSGSTIKIPENETTAWYRAWIEIPKNYHGYDLTGSRIWFQFQVSSVASEIIYFNGRRVALGEDLEPVVLVDDAKPGEKILVAVKVTSFEASRLRFNRTVLKVDFPRSRPSPAALMEQFLTVLVFVTNQSSATAERLQLEKAVTTVNLDAINAGQQPAFDTSLRQAQSQLEALRPTLENFTFYLTGNSHIDVAWLWPWTESVEAVRRTFGTAAQLLQEYPDYTYTQSTAQYSEWIAEKYPHLNEAIKRRIKEGRWEIVGGMWVEPDLNMPDGESLARQLLIGTRLFKSQYGVDVHIGWNPDSFGYSWQLPQIYKKSGIDYFVTSKLSTNETHKLPFKLFWWESPDGSRVLTYLPPRYDSVDLSPARLTAELGSTEGFAPGLRQMMDLYGVGDHGGGPTRALLDEGERWMQQGKVIPKMRFATAQSYFDSVERTLVEDSPVWNYQKIAGGFRPPATPDAGRVAIPTWKDELYYEFHRGTFTTQANQKRNMRESEEWILNSEKYASLAWLAGDPYPGKQLTETWQKILFNQFHDIAAGSGLGVLYKDAARDYEFVRLATNELSQKSLSTIASGVDTRQAGEVPVMVFNPLAWQRSGLVTVEVQMPMPIGQNRNVSVLDAKNHVVPSRILSTDPRNNTYKLLLNVQDVPSMGYKVLHVIPASKPFRTDLKVNGLTLENGALKLSVDPQTGTITSLYNKKENFETLAPGGQGNQLQTFADNPKCCDAWNIDPGTLDHPNIISKADSVELVENDPFQATIRVTRTWQNSKFVQDITLYAGSDHVEVTNDINWHEKHTLLKVAFPLAATSNFATYEIPYGTIERPTTRNNSWEETRFEVPALRWADLGDSRHGFSLINESKYGYDAKDNVLRLSLLRSPTSPDPDADQGHHHFSYTLYPHAGDWKQALTERRGYEYNYKLTAKQVQPHSGSLPLEYSYLGVDRENVVLTAMKKAEDAQGLILRIVEWAGKEGEVTIRVPPGANSATVTNLMERPEGPALKVINNTVTVPIHGYEILSLRVDYPRR
jgi:alpha-mannosidase